jgi:Contractile injection system tube protein
MNDQVLNSLPSAVKSTGIPAYLVAKDGKVLYSFLYNPEQKDFSRAINYESPETSLTSTQTLQYKNTAGRVLKLDNLLLDTYSSGKSLKPLIEGLQSLAVADVKNGIYSPPAVYFSWGSELFGPAVLTDNISWQETLWLGGVPAQARISITLTEVPGEAGTPGTVPTQSESTKAQAEKLNLYRAARSLVGDINSPSNPYSSAISLTARQQADGVVKGASWVKSNLSKLPVAVRQAFRQKAFEITVNAKGESTFVGREVTQSVGTYDGQTFKGQYEH